MFRANFKEIYRFIYLQFSVIQLHVQDGRTKKVN